MRENNRDARPVVALLLFVVAVAAFNGGAPVVNRHPVAPDRPRIDPPYIEPTRPVVRPVRPLYPGPDDEPDIPLPTPYRPSPHGPMPNRPGPGPRPVLPHRR